MTHTFISSPDLAPQLQTQTLNGLQASPYRCLSSEFTSTRASVSSPSSPLSYSLCCIPRSGFLRACTLLAVTGKTLGAHFSPPSLPHTASAVSPQHPLLSALIIWITAMVTLGYLLLPKLLHALERLTFLGHCSALLSSLLWLPAGLNPAGLQEL